MALTFPIGLSDFLYQLPVASLTCDLGEALEIVETVGGDVISVDLGPRLWQGQITLSTLTGDEWALIEPRLDVLRGGGATFLLTDLRRPFPRLEQGSVMPPSSPTILILDGSRSMRLAGLPPGFRLSAGDYLGFSYGTPARRALHRIVDATVTTQGDGTSPWFEVVPQLRPGVAAGLTVQIVAPVCQAIIRPGSVSKGQTSKSITTGVSFDWVQRIRP